MPELPEVETIRRQLAPHLEGRELTRRGARPRWSAPGRPGRSPSPSGRTVLALGRAGKYLVWELSRGPPSAHAPADDWHAPARPAHRPAAHARAAPARRRHRLLYSIRAASAPGTCCRARRRGTLLAARLGPEPLTPRFTTAYLRAPRAGRTPRSRRSCSISAGSPASATSTPTRRCSGRGSTRCGRRARCGPRSSRRCARRSRRARGRDRGQGRHDRRLPPSRRRLRVLPGPVPGPHARGRAVRPLRRRRSARSWSAGGARTCASAASRGRARRRARRPAAGSAASSRAASRSAASSSWKPPIDSPSMTIWGRCTSRSSRRARRDRPGRVPD